MEAYVTPRTSKERPATVIIQGGGNDLPSNPYNKKSAMSTVAEGIIKAGLKCRTYGVQNILIGSVTTRKGAFIKKNCEALNNILEGLCKKHKFGFINNDLIKEEHLYDGVHLNDEGSRILAENYLDALWIVNGV